MFTSDAKTASLTWPTHIPMRATCCAYVIFIYVKKIRRKQEKNKCRCITCGDG